MILGGNLAGADTKTHDISGPQLPPPLEIRGQGGQDQNVQDHGPASTNAIMAFRGRYGGKDLCLLPNQGVLDGSYTSTLVSFLLPFEDIFSSRKKDSGTRRNQAGRIRNSKISS